MLLGTFELRKQEQNMSYTVSFNVLPFYGRCETKIQVIQKSL